ncbi:uncharacterized protein LOC126571708 [Anopheles aquasalis]|uniref:uncharacterized protein LOC126571708 n=1 Tax=Anopheles aquasalis TaxID=42839 RepID=UPI00215A116E|nr:uncharacterized protein LOC126571708 [Anopheles aquasalis]
MDIFKFLFVLLLCTASARAFWWSTPQTNEIPPASKQVQYVRAFTYQPVAFPAHSLLAPPPSAFKFIQSSPALLPNSIAMGKQQIAAPLQTPSPPAQPATAPPSYSSPFSSFFGSAFGGQSVGSSMASHQQQQQQQQQQLQQQLQQQQQQQQVVPPPSVSQQIQNDAPSYNQAAPAPQPLPAVPSFFGQPQSPQPSKYPYFTMDQVQYLSSLPASSHTPQVQFVPCMCPIAVNVQSHGEIADKRLDETPTTDAEVVAPSTEADK